MKILQSNITLIVLVLACAVVGLYSYATNRPYELSELRAVNGKLAGKAVLHELGEGMQNYIIEIQLTRNDKRFFFRACAYELVDVERVLELKKGAQIELLVNNKEYAENEKLDIYSFSAADEGELLKLDDYNNCHSNVWKQMMPFITVLCIVLLYRILLLLGWLKPFKNANIPAE